MRYSEAHKAEVRETLLNHATRLVRSEGVLGTSVARVMGAAEMTVGGFYRHFDSQEALVGEALARAFRASTEVLVEGLPEGEEFTRGLVHRYLSEAHLANVDAGCPVAANVSELSRLAPLAARPLLDEVDAFVAESAHADGNGKARMWMVLACCVGGVAIARALGDEGPAVLRSIRKELLSTLPPKAPKASR
jgi:AcrR family transcriptional regulator